MATVKISDLITGVTAESNIMPLVSTGITRKATIGNIVTTKFPATARWDDLRVPVNALKVNPVTSKPDFETFRDGLRAYSFDPGTDESVFFAVQLPHDYLYGSNLKPHAHVAAMTTGSGTARFGLEYSLAENGSAFGATSTIYTTVDFDNEQYEHKYVSFANEIDCSAVDSVSAMVVCRFFRDANDSADDYAGEVALLEFDFHYRKDSFGSASEFVK
jgi:hypothetical protein